MAVTVSPGIVTSFPGARISFTAERNGVPLNLSTLTEPYVMVYYPGQDPQAATIHESDNYFTWIVPPTSGSQEASVSVQWKEGGVTVKEWGEFTLTINAVTAPTYRLMTHPRLTLVGDVYADIYDPRGDLVQSAQMTEQGNNYYHDVMPGGTWLNGIFSAAIRDATGVKDVMQFPIEHPHLAAMELFYRLPDWQRQVIEYIKYEMLSDTEPLHPGAWFTLEEYAKHWVMTTSELNQWPPYTNFPPESVPVTWANVMIKGVLLRVYQALANRAVSIPRFTSMPVPIQDESHYQQAWESRYNQLRPEYETEKTFLKGQHLTGPMVTVDPFLGWVGGGLAGSAMLSILSRPSWYSQRFGIR